MFYCNSQGEETGIFESEAIFIFLKFLYYKNKEKYDQIKKKRKYHSFYNMEYVLSFINRCSFVLIIENKLFVTKEKKRS